MQRSSQHTEFTTQDVSTLLRAWSGGDPRALEQLTPLVYVQLHRTAKRYLAGAGAGEP